MHRTWRLPLVAVALLSLLTPLVLTLTDARAAAAPELHLSTMPGAGNPLRVVRVDPDDPPPSPEVCVAAGGDPYGDTCQDVLLTIRGTTPLQDVTVTVVESQGLYVDPMVTTIADSGDNTAQAVGFVVRGRTTGLHTLTFEVTAPDSEPRSITLPYVWRSGGPPLPGGDSLAGLVYGVNGLDTYPCGADGGCSYRYSERLSFLDDTRASRSLAVRAKATCGPSGTCPTYHYDSETGLIQVGKNVIGRVTKWAAYFDGDRYARMAYPRRGQRFDAEWLFGAHVDEGRGIVEQRLILRPTGRFRLYYFVDTHRYPSSPDDDTAYERRMSGTYRIGRNGRLRLNDNLRKLTEIATLAVITTSKGRPRPATKGIWLDVSVDPTPPGRRFIDGNRMFALGG